jgi:hypothetical protein
MWFPRVDEEAIKNSALQILVIVTSLCEQGIKTQQI